MTDNKIALINNVLENLNKLKNALMVENSKLVANPDFVVMQIGASNSINSLSVYNFRTAAKILGFSSVQDFIATLLINKIIKVLDKNNTTIYYEPEKYYVNYFFKTSKFSHLRITQDGLRSLATMFKS